MNKSSQTDTVEFVLPSTPSPSATLSSRLQVDLAGLTDRGTVRPNNEDHFLIARAGRFLEYLQTNLPPEEVPVRQEEICCGMMVADGLGGHSAGETASRLAINSFVNQVLRTPDWILRMDDAHLVEEVARRAAERATQVGADLAKAARADPSLAGFGTTLTVAFNLSTDLFLVHVGDSRAYLLRRGKLHQLTHDHTLAQELADRGVIDQQEVATHRLRHVLNRALGDKGTVRPEVHRLLLEDGDALLLCTDGLTDMVEDAAIAATLGSGEPAEQVCRRLIGQALDAGGRDNVTVVVARYAFPPPP